MNTGKYGASERRGANHWLGMTVLGLGLWLLSGITGGHCLAANDLIIAGGDGGGGGISPI